MGHPLLLLLALPPGDPCKLEGVSQKTQLNKEQHESQDSEALGRLRTAE